MTFSFPMMKAFQRWDSWWMRTGPPHALALFRIGFGAYLVLEALTYLPHASVLFSTAGLVLPLQLGIPVPLPWLAYVLTSGFVAAAAMLAIGYRMRLALCILIAYFLYYWQLSFYAFPSSYHRIFFLSFLFLLLGGADKTLSLRMKMERGAWSAWEPVCLLPQRLIAVQLTATYAVVGAQKWWLPHWQDGDVLYYSFIGRWGTPLALWFVSLDWSRGTYDAVTLGTKFFETLMPVGVWIPRYRWFFFVGGFVFHLLVASFLSIWWFLVLPPAYVAFIEPEEVHAWLRRRFPSIMR